MEEIELHEGLVMAKTSPNLNGYSKVYVILLASGKWYMSIIFYDQSAVLRTFKVTRYQGIAKPMLISQLTNMI